MWGKEMYERKRDVRPPFLSLSLSERLWSLWKILQREALLCVGDPDPKGMPSPNRPKVTKTPTGVFPPLPFYPNPLSRAPRSRERERKRGVRGGQNRLTGLCGVSGLFGWLWVKRWEALLFRGSFPSLLSPSLGGLWATQAWERTIGVKIYAKSHVRGNQLSSLTYPQTVKRHGLERNQYPLRVCDNRNLSVPSRKKGGHGSQKAVKTSASSLCTPGGGTCLEGFLPLHTRSRDRGSSTGTPVWKQVSLNSAWLQVGHSLVSSTGDAG